MLLKNRELIVPFHESWFISYVLIVFKFADVFSISNLLHDAFLGSQIMQTYP